MNRKSLLALLFFLAGFATLVVEVLFSRLLQVSFGVSINATTAVTASFLAGLGLGALVLGEASRLTRKPTLIFGVLMLGLGAMLPVFPPLVMTINPLLASIFTGLEPDSNSFTLVRFAAAFALTLVPAFFMGGAFPFIIRAAVKQEGAGGSAGVGFFYAVNTIGAALGAVLCGCFLLQRVGPGATLLASSFVSAGVGIVAIVMGLKEDLPLDPLSIRFPNRAMTSRPDDPDTPAGLERRLMLAVVFLGGMIALSNQIIWTRILINVFGGTVYAFSIVLCISLAGLALGSWSLPGFLARRWHPATALAMLLVLSTAGTAAGMLGFRFIVGLDGPLGGADNLYPAGGAMLFLTLLRYAALAGIAVLPFFFFQGAVLPLATGCWAGRGDLPRFSGRLYALSALGAITGSLLAGFVVLPLISAEAGLMACAVAALILAALLFRGAGGPGKPAPVVAAGPGIGAVVLLLLAAFLRPAGGEGIETLFFMEGPAATAKVESFDRRGESIRSLRVNGSIMATTGFRYRRQQLLLGHLSALCHRNPKRILSVGLGTGLSSGALWMHGPAHLEIAELSRAVVMAAAQFAEFNHRICSGKARIIPADGRNQLLLTNETYDLIIADPVHPWVAGSSNLHSAEYFRLAASRLKNEGVMCHWVPLVQLPARDVRSVLATFHSVFIHVRVFLTGYDLVMIGAEMPFTFEAGDWDQRIRARLISDDLSKAGIRDLQDLAACFLFAETGLNRFTGDGARIIRDADQALEYSAPEGLWHPYDERLINDLLSAKDDIKILSPRGLWPSNFSVAKAAGNRQSYFEAVRRLFDTLSIDEDRAQTEFESFLEKQ